MLDDLDDYPHWLQRFEALARESERQKVQLEQYKRELERASLEIAQLRKALREAVSDAAGQL